MEEGKRGIVAFNKLDGSHIPPTTSCVMTASNLPGILFQYENKSCRQQRPAQHRKLTGLQLGRHVGGKDLRCFLVQASYVLICRNSTRDEAVLVTM